MKDRIYYIDYAKALGMLLIIAAHTFMWTNATSPVCYVACSFHVPIFFFISGLLFALFPREENFKTFLGKRTKALLIPYVCFSIFNAVQTLGVLKIQHNLTAERLHSELIELLITGNGTVWFLVTLFLAEMIFYGFKKSKSHVVMLSSALVLGLLAFVPWDGQYNPFMVVVNRAMSAYSFIVLGYYTKKLVEQKKASKLVLSIALIGLWIALLCLYPYNYEYFTGTFAKPLESILTITSASLGFILLLSCLDKRIAILEYIGKNSLLFMLCHPTFIKIYIVLGVSKITAMPSGIQILGSIVVFIIILTGTAVFGEIVRRWFPFAIGKKYTR